MQLRSAQPPSPESTWRATLEDIITQVQIEPNFCIRHPNYKPWELLPEIVERLQLLPTQLQRRCWSLHLRNFLYYTYYNGAIEPNLTGNEDTDDQVLHQNLENNSFYGVDPLFYDQLHESNNGTGYFDPGWRVLRQVGDGTLAVNKDGLTLHVERHRHLQLEAQSTSVDDTVAIRLPKNEVQNGYYVAISNVGRNNSIDSQVRIYFNLLAEGAVTIMASLTQELNDIYLPFSFKLLYNPSEYKRCDSGVLCFDKKDYADVRTVIEQIYFQCQSYFQPLVPLFTKLIAPGLALAEEPKHLPGKEGFGLNRCQMLADGLLDAWERDDNINNRLNSISQRFCSLGIELQRPYLNPNSEDIYILLDLEN